MLQFHTSELQADCVAHHSNKHIRAAIWYAEQRGWRVMTSKGHIWGELWCPEGSRAGCIIRVFSTPRNPENHAKHILHRVNGCPHP